MECRYCGVNIVDERRLEQHEGRCVLAPARLHHLIKVAKATAIRGGKLISKAQWDRMMVGWPSAVAVERVYGGWHSFAVALGVATATPDSQWERVLARLRELSSEGVGPSMRRWDNHAGNGFPISVTVVRKFGAGNWAGVLGMAGLKMPPTDARAPRPVSPDVTRMLQELRGETSLIAAPAPICEEKWREVRRYDPIAHRYYVVKVRDA